MPAAEVRGVLDALAAARAAFAGAAFFILDEPTNRPDFIEIFEYAARLELLKADSFIATNGAGLAAAGAETWRRLKDTGIGYLQFTFYGIGAAHDRFAGRRGAFGALAAAARGATANGIPWVGLVFLLPGDAGDVPGTMAYVRTLGPALKVGWAVYAHQGRGARGKRPRRRDVADNPALADQQRFRAESEFKADILADAELSARPAFAPKPLLTLDVYPGGRVYAGGACDCGAVAAPCPEIREEFFLGSLENDGLATLVARYVQAPPRALRILKDVTWGELARAYGDDANDELFAVEDLVISKWGSAFLRERPLSAG